MVDRYYCFAGIALRVSFYLVGFVCVRCTDRLQDLYLVDVYHDIWPINAGIQLLARSRNSWVVAIHLGTW